MTKQPEYRPQAKFNAAWAKCERIDAIHKQMHVARTDKKQLEYDSWMKSLYAELYERMTDADITEIGKLQKRIEEAKEDYTRKKSLQQRNPRIRIPYLYEDLLYKLELVLFKIEKAAGFSNPDMEEDGSASTW